MGTQQSGLLNLKIADLSKDQQLVVMAREEARKVLGVDPELQQPVHATLKLILSEVLRSKPNWGKIA
jgi:ATP-dependent DNA helicase RecG